MTIKKAVYVMVEVVTVGHQSKLEVFHDVTSDHDEAADWLHEGDNRRVIKQFIDVQGVREE